MTLQESETGKNLLKTFEYSAKRRMEYDIYALIAEQQGYSDISRLLSRFSNSEKEHSKLWYRWLEKNNGKFPKLVDCIKDALENESIEFENIYEDCIEQAKKDGLDHIAGLFEKISALEKHHTDRLEKLVLKLDDSAVEPNSDGTYNWVCSVCGAVFTEKEEPKYCPLCLKEEVFFYKRPNK